MPTWSQYSSGRQRGAQEKVFNEVSGEADLYRKALEKAAYGQAGNEYSGGLNDITNFLARSGPLADSGAKLALQKRLYSQIYGQARNQIGMGYAQYLAQALAAQRNYKYQKAFAKLQQTGVGGFLGGIAGIGTSLIPGFGGAKAATGGTVGTGTTVPGWTQNPWNY